MPKSLLPVNGRATLNYILTAVAEADIRNVCIVTHHMSEQIEKFVGDGSAWSLTAAYCRQPPLVGTAHALQTAVSFYPGYLSENGRSF